jgi:hypothetical protein
MDEGWPWSYVWSFMDVTMNVKKGSVTLIVLRNIGITSPEVMPLLLTSSLRLDKANNMR